LPRTRTTILCVFDKNIFLFVFNWKPPTKRSQGRPKYRWEDNIKQDICQTKIKIGQLASRIERNGRRRLLRRPKLSVIKESSATGKRKKKYFSFLIFNTTYLQ
jgi:hypothetical protein